MNPTVSNLATRPTYTRQISDASSIEMQRVQDRATTPLLNDPMSRQSPGLTTDVFTRNPTVGGVAASMDTQSPRGSTNLSNNVYEQGPSIGVPRQNLKGILGARGRPQLIRLPSSLRQALSAVGQTIGAHWRDLTVGSVLTGIVSWAIWATVKINRANPDIPYCVFEDPNEL